MKHIDKVIQLVLQDAHDRAESAGYSGRWDDGGASLLKMQVEFFNYGRLGVMPSSWEPFEKQVIAQSDPEYATYLKLKKKFG